MAKQLEVRTTEQTTTSNDKYFYLASASTAGWWWAFGILAGRRHLVDTYFVTPDVPPLWGFLGLPLPLLLAMVVAASGLLYSLKVVFEHRPQAVRAPTVWLASSFLIPLIDFARIFYLPQGAERTCHFAELLWFIALTGATVSTLAAHSDLFQFKFKRIPTAFWFSLSSLASLGAAMAWYQQGLAAYDDFMIGFHDFGHFARRVVNTWEGRGFLIETPSLPPFWDHFNPGLVLLTPLWGIWNSAKVFILIQAISLASPALFIFGIARRHGYHSRSACAWSLAFLLFPNVSQMNLNFTYGWHPVSLTLPFLFGTLWALSSGHRLTALGLAIIACSFHESAIVIVGCFACAMALQPFLVAGKVGQRVMKWSASCSDLVCRTLPPRTWFIVWITAMATFFLVYKFSGLETFQKTRVADNLQIASAFKLQTLYFIGAMLLPIGLTTIARGWPLLIALALPMGVLFAWSYPHATSIAFQYSTTLLPVLFVAAIAGIGKHPEVTAGVLTRETTHVLSIRALAGGLVASVFIGAMPWSQPTLTNVRMSMTYPIVGDTATVEERKAGSNGNVLLGQVIERVGSRDASVLATSRVAAHLLHVRRLEPVNEAINRWEQLATEAGAGRSPVEVFDWIVFDTLESFQQTKEEMQRIHREALERGYETVLNEQNILVLRRPTP